MSNLDCEVVSVGAGPVGETLAILLAQRGHSVIVLERWAEPYPLPRAVHFDEEVGRILQSCGIGDRLRAMSEPAPVYEWRNAAGMPLLKFGRSGDAASGWPMSSMFCQPELEALLEDRLAQLPMVELRRGVEVADLEQRGDRVVVRDTVGDEVHSRYVIGCDGANSTVRDLAALPVEDLGFFYDWLIVDLVLAEPRVFDPLNVQICDPARPTTAVSGGPGRRRWEFMRLPGESIEELSDPGRAWELLGPWDVHPGNARLERHAVYTFNARHAQRWRAGRVLIAGDAAHQMPPFAGQGMCAGIRDAANLAWKLDQVLSGAASDELLDTYEQERLPHARQAIEFSMELGKVICVADPEEAATRDELMAASVGDEPAAAPRLPGLVAGLVSTGSLRAGEMFIQGTLLTGQRFDDVYGAGWRLLTVESTDELAATELAAFDQLGGKVIDVSGESAYVEWFAVNECTWALQRPDFYLYGTASCARDALELLVDLRRRLSGIDDLQGVT